MGEIKECNKFHEVIKMHAISGDIYVREMGEPKKIFLSRETVKFKSVSSLHLHFTYTYIAVACVQICLLL